MDAIKYTFIMVADGCGGFNGIEYQNGIFAEFYPLNIGKEGAQMDVNEANEPKNIFGEPQTNCEAYFKTEDGDAMWLTKSI